MKIRLNAVVLTLAVVVVALAVVRMVGPDKSTVEVTLVPHFQLADADVRVSITDDPQVSRGHDPMLVQLESGTIPASVTHLTVLTDENCQPDADGVSHCLNRVKFMTVEGTGEATLRHHHRMAEESCLTPGQTVELVG